MKWLLILMGTATGFFAQDAVIQAAVERNPFDPNRGQKEASEETPEVVDEKPAEDLPILDGTMVLGKTSIAFFTYTEEGETISKGVRLNQKVAGYEVVEILAGKVNLRGSEQAFEIHTFSAEKPKEKRGGTKKAPAKPRSNAKKSTTRGKPGSKDAKNNKKPDMKKDQKKQKFNPRKRTVPKKRNPKVESAKRKF